MCFLDTKKAFKVEHLTYCNVNVRAWCQIYSCLYYMSNCMLMFFLCDLIKSELLLLLHDFTVLECLLVLSRILQSESCSDITPLQGPVPPCSPGTALLLVVSTTPARLWCCNSKIGCSQLTFPFQRLQRASCSSGGMAQFHSSADATARWNRSLVLRARRCDSFIWEIIEFLMTWPASFK